jgi:putative membrane protein
MVTSMADTKQPVPGIGDGLRRAQLAAERTYLAWWRTALATVAVAIAIGRVLPEVLNAGTTWPYVVVGAGWGVLAVAIAAYAPVRQRALRRAIDEGGYAHPHTAMLSARRRSSSSAR